MTKDFCGFCGQPFDKKDLPVGSPAHTYCSKKCRTRRNSLNYLEGVRSKAGHFSRDMDDVQKRVGSFMEDRVATPCQGPEWLIGEIQKAVDDLRVSIEAKHEEETRYYAARTIMYLMLLAESRSFSLLGSMIPTLSNADKKE